MSKPIYFFSKNDPYYELSNFAPFGFEEHGVFWPTVEHYFQASKFTDTSHRARIVNAHSPQQAKALGQSRAVPLRPDWEEVKVVIMKHALRRKFSIPRLRVLLLETKSRPLIENSPHDRFWGIGSDGRGKNVLGQLLTEVRAEIRAAVQGSKAQRNDSTH